METIIDKVISDAVKGACLYSYRGSTWLINPEKKQWVVTVYNENGYLFYSHDFFTNLFRYLDITLGDNNLHVKRWVENKLGLKVGDNYHPDYLFSEYDWSGDFDAHEVIREGVKL